jgi:hypothetical protein
MNAALLLIPFAAPIAGGCAAWAFTSIRDRRRMAAAFRHGRTDVVVHLPAPRPVEAWPVWIAIAQDEAA